MHKYKVAVTGFTVALLVMLATGCGQQTVNSSDTTRPEVLTTTPAQGATGIALNTRITATFSEEMNCSTLKSPASGFTVAGPGGVSVTGTVECAGSSAAFTPTANLAPNSLFTATISNSTSDLAGNTLDANFLWSFRTGSGVVAAPAVIFTTPANQATGVATNRAVSATFSEAMNPATVNTTTFTLTGSGGTAVSGTVTYVGSGSQATFSPSANLAASTTYTALITSGAEDLTNTPLANNFSWTFTTAAGPDTTKPTVISVIPTNAHTNVPLNRAVSATFSEAMNPVTITSTSFTLTGPAASSVSGLVSYAAIGSTATFTPANNLAANTLYTATVTTSATDLANNALAANYTWSFTTGAAADTTEPIVTATIPLSAATGVPTNQTVSATFDEAMDPLTITSNTFHLTGPGGSLVAGTVVYDPINFIATLTPSALFAASTTYTATVSTGATDLAGNPLGSGTTPNPWSFTTGTVIVPPPVNLGTAALFGAMGAAGLTNQGTATVINGNISTTGVSTVITRFHDNGVGCTYTETPLNKGIVNGSIDTAPPPPTVGCPTEGTAITSAIAAKAALDALTAYGALVAFPGGLDVSTCPGCGGGSAGELGSRTLPPAVYKAAPGTYGITLGDLTLDAQGDPNAFWVFQMATTLTVGTPSAHRSVILVNGAQAKNVFWQVGTAATINGILGGATFQGTVIAQAGVSISTAGVAAVTTINGRAMSLSGPVTMVNTVINVPAP